MMRNLAVAKRSLSLQTLESLRTAILQGEFGSILPPERQLAYQMEVSRPVLREALNTLEQESLIVLRGRRRSVNASAVSKKGIDQIESVRLLSSRPLDMLENEHMHLAEFMSSWLLTRDIDFRMEVSSASFKNAPQYQLADLLKRSPHTLWLLYRSTPAMQGWFQDHKIPCIVLGGLYPNVALPSINRDYRALCRHAAGLLRGRGYSRVAIFCRDRILPGDQDSIEGFEAGWHRSGDEPGALRYASHDGSPESLTKAAASLWRSKNCPPVWFVFGSRHVFTLIAWMACEGIRLGQDIHLISRDSCPYFEAISGTIAHYHHNVEQFKSGLKRLVLRLIEQNQPKRPKPHIIDAEFVDGRSLKN